MIFIKRIFIIFLFLVSGMYYSFEAKCQIKPNQADTTAIALPDSTKEQPNGSERLLENIKQLSKRKTIVGKGLDLLFDFEEKSVAGALNPELLSNTFEEHNYKIVRRIIFRRLNSFGYSISDTIRQPHNFLEKAGNSIHIKTHRGRIRNKLLFKTGEALEPQALSESERLLRQTEYLLDARVVVEEKTNTQDSVDIIVTTKDVFSLGGSVAFNTNNGAGRVSLNDINFLGLGHQFRNTYQFGLDSIRRSWTYTGSYTIENIYNTYVAAQVVYLNEIHYQEKGLSVYRDFYTTNTKYAGAMHIKWYNLPIQVRNYDGNNRRLNIDFSRQDVWFGKSFRLKSYDLGYESRARIITAGRLIATNYTNSPNADYQNNVLYLGGIGYSFRKYYRDQYLFGFGRTEDVPAGSLIALSAGYEVGDLYNRPYVGAKMAFGKYSTNFGYLYFDAQFDSFIRGKKWEQGEFSSEMLYFTKMLTVGNWQWRHFIWNRTSIGINRKYGENILSISRQEGVRGFRTPGRGTRKFVLNYESSLFTPFSFLGFRLALVNFADVAWLSDGNGSNPFRAKPFQGYGLGIRFRNEYMAFNTIQILLGYYPQGNSPFKTYNSTRPYYDFNDFRFTQPLTSDFR